MPLPNILEFIGTNVTQAGFKVAQQKLLDYLGAEVSTKAELNSTVSTKAEKAYVDTALALFQNGAIRTYPTLAEANIDIANIALNTKVSILSAIEGGDYYKATAGATSLTKSPYDPYIEGKNYAKNIAQSSFGIAISENTTLTAKDIEHKNISFMGALTSNVTVTLPALEGNWVFRNLTTGGFKVLVKCDQQTTESISLFNAEPIPCYASGRNLFAVSAIVAKRHLNISLTGKTEVTLSADDIKHDTIFFGGTQTADLTVYFPKNVSKNIVRHQASGGFNILLKVQDSSNQSLIKNGEMIEVYSDAINLYQVDNRKAPLESPVFTGSPTTTTPDANATTGIANVGFVNRRVCGASYIAITGNKTLTAEESSVHHLTFTGTLTEDATIIVPDGAGAWTVSNRTTGGFTLNFKVAGQSLAPLTLPDNGYYEVIATGGAAYFAETVKKVKTNNFSLTGSAGTYNLTADQVRNDVIFLGGTITQDTVINFPKVKGSWHVRHQAAGGFKLLLKILDSNEPAIEITNQQFVTVISDQINLYLIDKQNQTGVHRGEFKDRAIYNMNDIVEHGSGTYKVISAISQNAVNPMTSQSYKKIGCRPINNKTISVVSESAKAIDGVNVRRVRGISKDGTTFFSNQPYAQITESKDFGKTWTKLFDIPQAEAGLIEQLDDGELIIFVTESAPTTNLVRRIYKTVGYGTDNPQLVSVKMQQRDKIYYGGQWGFDAYKNIVIACEYGAKYVPTNTGVGDVDVEGGNARYVYLSTDFGKTWKTIFDLNTKTNGVGVHIHSAVFDPYWNRIWVHHGDGSFNRNGMYYSDDFGETWTYALQTNNSGANFPQSTCTVVLPDCILFGSDSMPNGVLRLDRSQGKQPYKGYYTLEIAWKHPETSDTLLNAVCYKVAHAKHIPDTPYIFAFAPENLPTKGVLVATYDGYTFFQLWQDSTTRSVGNGPRHVVGVTLQNEVIAQVQDDRFDAGVHTELRLKVV